jgi:putative transposase
LRKLYFKKYGTYISTNKIQKVINKLQLYPDTKEHNLRLKRKRSRKKRILIHTFKTKKQLGYLWHTDSIIIWWYGERKVIFTAIEDQTKIAYARVYSSSSSTQAADFLKRLVYLSNNHMINIHHDNGSEFKKEFEKACQALSIKQIYSRVKTPKDNPALERFNYTIQDEWLSVSEIGLDNLDEANLDLTSWLMLYNNLRPHESLDYQTPLEYAVANFKVSPMWASCTGSC